ncbi:hypothetical protein ACFYE2_14840 [Kocuria sp. CPCC 205300]|uniref:hypothetical protein n=1 Tax=Kocuria sabuli TaxID=3071448 RepID=UPI0036DCF2CD
MTEESLPLSEGAISTLQRYPGVQAVAFGRKETAGQLTDQLAAIVMVQTKRPLEELPVDEVIPQEIEGLPTDVVEVGVFTLDQAVGSPDTSKVRPLEGGIQIQALHGGVDPSTGTLGCFGLTKEAPRQVVMLSNAHVLGDSDSHVTDTVGQPAMCSICSTCCSDPVGKVLRFKKTDRVDGALATLDEGVGYAAQIKEIGAVAGVRELSATEAATLAIQVQKRGRTTGHTFGTVRAWIPGPFNIMKHDGSVSKVCRDALWIEVRAPSPRYSAPGDSGAAVLDMEKRVVGLHFGGSDGKVGLACPIQFVTSELEIDILDANSVVPVITREATIPALVGIAGGPAEKLLETPAGRYAAVLYDRHATEIRDLVRTNARVSAVWRRHGGPALILALARAAEEPNDLRLPEELDGKTFAEQIETICHFFARYASDELRTAIERHAPQLAGCAGLTLAQAAELLSPDASEKVRP